MNENKWKKNKNADDHHDRHDESHEFGTTTTKKEKMVGSEQEPIDETQQQLVFKRNWAIFKWTNKKEEEESIWRVDQNRLTWYRIKNGEEFFF